MGKKDNQFVALVHESCPICGKDMNDSILLHTRLGDLKSIDGKSTGFSEKPCEECQKGIDMGAIMIIVADKDKSGDGRPENLWRTGNIFGIKEKAVMEMLGDAPANQKIKEEILLKRALVMDYRDAIAFGLPVKYTP